nr:alanine:cation symporter family protein [uncultured Sellimonas sp.]
MGKEKEAVNWKRVLILAGAVIAFTIGSGFATGQEIIQYYTAYGVQSILVILVFAVAFLYYNFNFAKAGAEQKFERGNDVYKYFCGKYVGTFCDYYSTVFCYMSFWVMVGGAASTLNQEYNLPTWVGAVVLTVLAIITVVGGLNSLVDAIGVVGPIIVVLCIFIGLVTCIIDGGNIPEGLEVIRTGAYEGAKAGETIKNAGPNWLISGLSYAGFVLLWFASFTAALGSKNKKKDLNYGIVGGTVAVCVAIGLICFAQIANINTILPDGSAHVWNADIPNLILAMKIWKPFSAIFAIVVFAGIYTTAVPLLYNPAARFAKEGTPKFKMLTIVLGVIGLLVGLFLPFRVLVNIIYVLNGYVGAVLILFMIKKNICDFLAKKKKA